MGRNNKQRRAAKAKARRSSAQQGQDGARQQGSGAAFFQKSHSSGSTDPMGAAPPRPTVREQVRELVDLMLWATGRDETVEEQARAQVLRLASGSPAGGRAVGRCLTALLRDEVALTWRRGWEPADLYRVVSRDFPGGRGGSGPEQGVLADVMAAELAGYARGTVQPRWWGQLAELGAQTWWPPGTDHLTARAEVDGWEQTCPAAWRVLGVLARLPEIGVIGPLPGRADPTAQAAAERANKVDQRILGRVRALLAKAESTTYEPEAETFTAGAQALMARHSIDAAMLDAARDTEDHGRTGPGALRIGVDRPYEHPKAVLLDQVARANRCNTVWSQHFGFTTVLGFPPDLRAVETLFTSLLVQATAAMRREGSRRTEWGQSRTRSFRQSFLTAYATRIGERLTEVAREEEERAAGNRPGGPGDQRAAHHTDGITPAGRRTEVLPVLAARSREVDDATAAMFPELVQRQGSRVSDAEGWHRGRAAAEQARLTGMQELPVDS